MSENFLTVPEPKIELYKTGFEGVCQLGRAADGKKLSDLVERISEPMVVAVDAPWGAGKSVFLKCWVGSHALETSGTTTVYFDAFRHDFMDDPLIGLTGVISERLDHTNAQSHKWQRAKEAAFRIVLPTLRTGLAIATAGATEISGSIVTAGLNASSDELKQASKDFWKKEDGRRAAMEGFREALKELAADQKLVIVVDELDRCRPDYALNLLEVIKHFFDVPNVHFILGVNLKELANSVRSRYGKDVKGEKYLQKFITVSMPLVPPTSRHASARLQIKHFENISKEIGLKDNWKYDSLSEYPTFIDHHANLTLRDVEKIATLAMVTPNPPGNFDVASMHFYIGLLILQVLTPSAVAEARLGNLRRQQVFSILNLGSRPHHPSFKYDAHVVWQLVTNQDSNSRPSYLQEASQDYFPDGGSKEILRKTISETLDVFQIMS